MTSLPPSNQHHRVHGSLCQAVRETCRDWVEQHTDWVTVSDEAVDRVVRAWSHNGPQQVAWDQEGWHYVAPAHWPESIRRQRLAAYILALDAINFCFWPLDKDTSPAQPQPPGEHDHSQLHQRQQLLSSSSYEYDHLAKTLTALAQLDHDAQEQQLSHPDPTVAAAVTDQFFFSAHNLQAMTVPEMYQAFVSCAPSSHPGPSPTSSSSAPELPRPMMPPNLATRCALWNEIGQGLLDHFKGSAWRLIQHAQRESSAISDTALAEAREIPAPPTTEHGPAVTLVHLLFQYFAGFRDCVGLPPPPEAGPEAAPTVYFLKRAQICVADWDAALQLQLPDLDQLTTFADYRVPQLLRHWGILSYHPQRLAPLVDQHISLLAGSREEVSIRAATVVAVEKMVQRLVESSSKRGENGKAHGNTDGIKKESWSVSNPKWTAVRLDWYLWQEGERLHQAGELRPHHRVETIYY